MNAPELYKAIAAVGNCEGPLADEFAALPAENRAGLRATLAQDLPDVALPDVDDDEAEAAAKQDEKAAAAQAATDEATAKTAERSVPDSDLDDLSKTELQDRAEALNIPSFRSMNKPELIAAIAAAERGGE